MALKLFLALVAVIFMGTSSTSKAACPADYNRPLELAVAKFVQAVRGNSPGDIISLIGSQGITIGQEGEPMSAAELAADFNARKGRYCDFFTCAGKPGFMRALVSGGASRSDISQVNGNLFAVVTLNPGSGTSETELHFVYTAQCRWELTAIGYL